ncbi:MAG: hypothetical protein RR065_11930 [Clostridia bacterium]
MHALCKRNFISYRLYSYPDTLQRVLARAWGCFPAMPPVHLIKKAVTGGSFSIAIP